MLSAVFSVVEVWINARDIELQAKISPRTTPHIKMTIYVLKKFTLIVNCCKVLRQTLRERDKGEVTPFVSALCILVDS